jgi:hypothetical protein
MMEALLTGSRVYGTPRLDSDLDMAVLCTHDEWQALAQRADSCDGGQEYAKSKSLHFGELNILCFVRGHDEEAYLAWRLATLKLHNATRELAVDMIQHMWHLRAEHVMQQKLLEGPET